MLRSIKLLTLLFWYLTVWPLPELNRHFYSECLYTSTWNWLCNDSMAIASIFFSSFPRLNS